MLTAKAHQKGFGELQHGVRLAAGDGAREVLQVNAQAALHCPAARDHVARLQGALCMAKHARQGIKINFRIKK